MTLPIFLVLALLVTVMVCFALEKISVDIITLLLLCALVLLRLLPIREAFAGFSSDIVIVLAALFVLSGALIKTGVMENFGSAISKIAGTSRTRVLLVLMPATACIAAFLHNTTTTAVFLPAVLGLCRKSRLSPSQVLIPFAFASMMGGTCTLLASSTTIAASGYMASAGLRPIGLFEFLPFGLAVVGTGILYMVAIGARFLPRRAEGSLTDSYQVREYLSEVVVTGRSPLAGRTMRELRLSAMGLTVLAIHRGDQTLYPGPGVSLEAGDLLIVKARREALLEVKQTEGMEIVPDLHLGDKDLVGGTVKIAEAIIMPQSLLIGRTLRELNFRHRFGLTVIAVHRRGHAFPTKIGTLSLRVGDVLLLQGDAERFTDLGNSLDVWVLEQTEHYAGARRSRQRLLAVGLFAAAVGAAGLGVLPLAIAFLLAALAAILLKLISTEEAYKSIHWRLIILIAGMTSFGAAMKSSGAAAYLANLIVHWGAPLGIPYILLAFAVLTMLLSQPMSNAAAALVVLPVALSTATALHVQPRTFGIVVTLAASISYITPFEPSCLLVYGPGKYRFRDFLIAGAPLSLLLLGVLMVLAPLLWPLR
ncbi:MAG TPA: SLC13 family permease [Thermoanaerobaculia bacterium]|nr:SLC13 family permease [Thermoanaerobaculia bacterium]